MNPEPSSPRRIWQFKSPPHKTVSNAIIARDAWKSKYMVKKDECAKLAKENRALADARAYLEQREERWKARALAAEKELREVRRPSPSSSGYRGEPGASAGADAQKKTLA